MMNKVRTIKFFLLEITEQHILIEDTSTDPMETATTNKAFSIATEENVATMSKTI